MSAYNKKIKSFATAHWDAQKAARPLFKRYSLNGEIVELKEFIKETLVDIAMGVREANNEIGNSVNGSNELFKLRRNVSKEDVASNIEFDIALTVQKGQNDKAGFVVAIAPIVGSASFLKSKKTENVHRIKFKVNVNENWR